MRVAQRKRRRNLDADILAEVEAQAARGLTGAAIHRHLESMPGVKARVPSVRTIQSIVADLEVPDASGEWSFGEDEGDGSDAGFVLGVVRALIEWSEGERRTVTKSEARWLKRIHRVAPDLDSFPAYLLARAYVRAGQQGESTRDLDVYLAYAPWRVDEATDGSGEGGRSNLLAFRQAVAKGWVSNEARAFSREALRLVEEPPRASRKASRRRGRQG